jgi:DNA-binding NarL/FixJ family response regulator
MITVVLEGTVHLALRPAQTSLTVAPPLASPPMFLSTETVSVAICSSHPIIREGLWKILAEEGSFHVCDTPLPLDKTVAWVEEMHPDVVLHDVSSTEETLAFLAAIKECHTHTKVIILLNDFLEEFAVRAVHQGAFGCLLKTASPQELIKAVYATHAGELWLSRHLFARVLNTRKRHVTQSSANGQLTRRQRQIVELVTCGMCNRDIAERLLISEATVRAHMNDIFKKLGLHHRVELAILARSPMCIKGDSN